jgi:hypothetical protein
MSRESDLDIYKASLDGDDFEEALWGQLRTLHLSPSCLPMPERQYQFDPPHTDGTRRRLWRADFFWPYPHNLICEVDGGGYGVGPKQGRHMRGLGYEKDRERDAAAMLLGLRVLRVTPKQVTNGQASEWIEALLGVK